MRWSLLVVLGLILVPCPPLLMTQILLSFPKDNPKSMLDSQPISLYNVLYKLVSKVLTNRLKVVLHTCISIEQSAFVPDLSILDNAMIAFEVIHYIKNKHKQGEIALNIDIYDRVDWNYLLLVLQKLGFHDTWVGWIKMCIESVSYFVLVNNESVGPIVPGRVLRQGGLSVFIYSLF